MSAKKLDQSVFDGLPKNVRFAAIGELGRLWTCSSSMKPIKNGDWMPVADWFTVALADGIQPTGKTA